MNALQSLKFFLPETFLLCGAFFALFLDLFIKNKKSIGALSLVVLVATAFLAKSPGVSMPLFFGFFTLDPFTHFFRLLALGIVAITVLVSMSYKPLQKNEGEYYSLFLFMAFALILMASATNLLMIFLGMEFVSVLSYLLVGFLKKDPKSKEAAIKYFLFGSLCSGIMLYGISILFGISGSLDLMVIKKSITPSSAVLALTSLVFFLTGLGFKISMVPFHMWAPDVYESAPTPVTGFLTVGPKALGFALLIRILAFTFSSLSFKWHAPIMFLSIMTMTIGNILAISQVNIKRLLAYSSIAQAGYILMGIAVFNDTGITGVFIYLLAYAFTNLGAFVTVIACSNDLGTDDISAYSGLSKRSPFLAFCMTLFMLSLAGIPPMAGFIGKFYVFSSAIEKGFITLAVAAAINSAVAAFYYFKVVRLMYLVEPIHEEPIKHSAPIVFALCLLVAGILILGIFPAPFINFLHGILV